MRGVCGVWSARPSPETRREKRRARERKTRRKNSHLFIRKINRWGRRRRGGERDGDEDEKHSQKFISIGSERQYKILLNVIENQYCKSLKRGAEKKGTKRKRRREECLYNIYQWPPHTHDKYSSRTHVGKEKGKIEPKNFSSSFHSLIGPHMKLNTSAAVYVPQPYAHPRGLRSARRRTRVCGCARTCVPIRYAFIFFQRKTV